MGKKVRVLQLLGGGKSIGGVEKMLLNYYSHIDHSKVIFDFCFYRKNTFGTVYEEFSEVLKDSQIFELDAFKENSSFAGYIKTIPKVKKIIIENRYDIVHINAGRPPLLLFGLIASVLAGVKIRIVHSHSTKGKDGRSNFANFVYDLGSSFTKYILCLLSSHLFGCSNDAGTYMFGNRAVKSTKYTPIHNAINVEPYRFCNDIRDKIRLENKINDNTLLFGHVGRFSAEKNHSFLLDVFCRIHEIEPNSKLWIVGDGDEKIKCSILNKINDLELNDSVKLLGSRKDVNCLDQAFDAMIFPSLYEGLSVVLVEAQVAALPVFASTNLSLEHKFR